MTPAHCTTHLVVITGMSGSGKSVALNALEDSGFYCIDNLPPEFLAPLIELERGFSTRRLAVAVDARSATSLPLIPGLLTRLRQQGVCVDAVFLDAATQTLIRRFSETRRRHPLSQEQDASRLALEDAIELERELLSDLRNSAHVIDTSALRSLQLQSYIKALLDQDPRQLTLVFESFGFKRGIPLDADYVFDVRMLPNPHYEADLRPLTGMDEPVARFLQSEPDVERMFESIAGFLRQWLQPMAENHRSYVTVAIGCTGGQHRSVYLVERLSAAFQADWPTLKRHRELDAR